jgi:hypothetical protein
VRLYGRFLSEVNDLSPRIIAYLNQQLDLPPVVTVLVPNRKATYIEYRKNILAHLGFEKFNEATHQQLESWLVEKAHQGLLPNRIRDYVSRSRYVILVERSP